MADEKALLRARMAYDNLRAHIDGRGWQHQDFDDQLSLRCSVNGQDLVMDILLHVNPDFELVTLLSRLPFNAPQELQMEFAIASNILNSNIIDGSFDFNIYSGEMMFRLSCSYIDRELTNGLIEYIINCSLDTIDAANDKLKSLADKTIDLEQFAHMFA